MTDKMRRLGLWLTDVDIPPPDYSDSDDQQDDVTDEELIAAKKLVNPCLESKEYKALRRELKLNQKLYVVNELCQLLNQSPITHKFSRSASYAGPAQSSYQVACHYIRCGQPCNNHHNELFSCCVCT